MSKKVYNILNIEQLKEYIKIADNLEVNSIIPTLAENNLLDNIKIVFNHLNSQIYTAFFDEAYIRACSRGYLDIVKYFYDYCNDIVNEKIPFSIACKNKQKNILDFITSKNSRFSYIINNDSYIPLIDHKIVELRIVEI